MFNFKLYNAALEDANLTDKEFRMLCLFLNKSSMDKSDTIEMFNGFLMDKLNLCERHIRRLTNSLEKKGYFTKTITGTVRNRNANTYILKCTEKCDKNVPPCNIEDDDIKCDKNVDIKCDKNVPLNNLDIKYNNNNITKDLSTSTRTSTEVTLLEENKKYKIKNISSEVTPSTGTFQDEVESVFLNSSDDEWLSYEVKRSMMGEVNNNLKLIDMKENEMKHGVCNAMNVNEQGSNYIAECGTTTNEMTTSTSGDKNITSREFQNIPVDKSKVINNDCNVQGVNPNAKDCAPRPATEEWKPIAWDEDAIFGLGEPQNVSGDKLSTNEEKTQPEPQECPQNEFNRERMFELFKISAKETVLERFKEQLKEMDAYMQYLKKNDHFTYKIYLKEILSWWNNPMNVWNSDFDFICVGNGFKRKYVA